jgi:putative Holliday junction resolvase
MGILASPLIILAADNKTQSIEDIIGIVNQYQVGVIVVGLPRSMDGSLGEQAEKINEFVQTLRNSTDISVELRDERLTTVSARRLMRSASTKKSKKKVKDDAVAAAVILQSYLDEEKE